LTGGLGCGKSTVAELFAGLGAEVVDTDVIARELTAPGGAALAGIEAAFGATVLAPDGGLDRSGMRRIIFADATARRRLEAVLHPLILARAGERLRASMAPYVVLVVPLLVETGAYVELIDRVALVDCDPAQQIVRVLRRAGMTEPMARAIMAAQADQATRLAAADDVIDNRGTEAELVGQVEALHRAYLSSARMNRHVQPLH
jgi:dephospho-CoA kinase